MQYIFLFFIFLLPIQGSQTFIKERLIKAQPGDYALYEKQKNQHLLHIHSIQGHKIILEEMSYSKRKMKGGVKDLLQKNKPEFSSHNILEINLETGKVLECYSFTQKRFIDVSKEECFILNLIELDFQKVANENRRKIGPAAHDGIDRRKIWNPPYIVDGKKQSADFQVLQAKWPSDNSPMAGKMVQTYFDSHHPFAHWIEIKDNSGYTLRVSCKDSGKNLRTDTIQMPRRRPRIISSLKESRDILYFKISCPPYYEDFKLYAKNAHSEFCTPSLVHFTSHYQEKNNILTIHLDKKELKKILDVNQSYCLEFHAHNPIHSILEIADSFFLDQDKT